MKKVIFILVFYFGIIQGKCVIIFDLGGVVFRESEHFILDNLPEQIRIQFPSDFPRMRVFLRAMDFVNLIMQKDIKEPWLFGNFSGTEIAKIIHDNIDTTEYTSFFVNEYERLLIKYGAFMMFDPEELARWTYLYPEAFQYIKECKKAGMRLGILSNWDPLSFAFIKKKNPELFELFNEEDIFIPALLGCSKPDKKVYMLVLEKLNVRPEDCCFIDDSKKNIEVAIECGIESILHTDWQSTKEILQLKR